VVELGQQTREAETAVPIRADGRAIVAPPFGILVRPKHQLDRRSRQRFSIGDLAVPTRPVSTCWKYSRRGRRRLDQPAKSAVVRGWASHATPASPNTR